MNTCIYYCKSDQVSMQIWSLLYDSSNLYLSNGLVKYDRLPSIHMLVKIVPDKHIEPDYDM